jgi:hypothetical protein
VSNSSIVSRWSEVARIKFYILTAFACTVRFEAIKLLLLSSRSSALDGDRKWMYSEVDALCLILCYRLRVERYEWLLRCGDFFGPSPTVLGVVLLELLIAIFDF